MQLFRSFFVAAWMFFGLLLPRPANAWQWNTGLENSISKAREVHKPILVFFFADNSAQSAAMDRETWTDVTVQARANGFVMTRLNVESAPREVAAYSVRVVPTTVFLDDNGKFTGQVVGKLNAAEATGIMSTALDRFDRLGPPSERGRGQQVATPAPKTPARLGPQRGHKSVPVNVTADEKHVVAAPDPKLAKAKLDAPARKSGGALLATSDVVGLSPSPEVVTEGDASILLMDESGVMVLEKPVTVKTKKIIPKKKKKSRKRR